MRDLPLSTSRFERQLHDPDRLQRGLGALVAIAVAYAVAILLLALGGHHPNPAPWLAVPDDTYFYWEAVFIGPVIFFGGLLAAATMHLFARGLGGTGTFDDTVALLGTATAISTLTTVIPDTVVGLLLVAGIVDAKDSVGWAGFVVYQLFLYVFVR